MVGHQGVAETEGGRREYVGHGGVEGRVVGVGVGGGVPARGGSVVDSEFFFYVCLVRFWTDSTRFEYKVRKF